MNNAVSLISDLFNSLIGEYTPITYTSYAQDGSAIEVIPDGLAGVDFSYVLSGLLIIVTFYAVLRIIGGFLHNV